MRNSACGTLLVDNVCRTEWVEMVNMCWWNIVGGTGCGTVSLEHYTWNCAVWNIVCGTVLVKVLVEWCWWNGGFDSYNYICW